MSQPKLLIASRNPGKMREYRQLLQHTPFELVSLDDLGITEEVEETGLTFAENATLKARAYAAHAGLVTLADDSGLEVDALGGEPGIRSARYGELADSPRGQGELAVISDRDRVNLLLRNLEGIPWERRTARFRCVIAIVTAPSRPQQGWPKDSLRLGATKENLTLLVGSVAGMIQYESIGDEGFGYDPVFYLPSYGLTMAQLPLEEKNLISHRANAVGKAVPVLKTWSNRYPEVAEKPERD